MISGLDIQGHSQGYQQHRSTRYLSRPPKANAGVDKRGGGDQERHRVLMQEPSRDNTRTRGGWNMGNGNHPRHCFFAHLRPSLQIVTPPISQQKAFGMVSCPQPDSVGYNTTNVRRVGKRPLSRELASSMTVWWRWLFVSEWLVQ